MLELEDITFTIDKDGEDVDLIHKASLKVSPGHFMAIVGPSGCGKTTLLKIIAGLHEESDGRILWNGRDLVEKDLEPSEIGYVPQFSIAFDHLTVEESVECAIRLRVKTRNRQQVYDLADSILAQVGLDDIRDNLVKVISGGQKRRLGLALELVSNPTLLLCDEVTSGLDPKSEREIVHLMHKLSQASNRIVINVTHSLSNLELYDTVLVLFDSCVIYHGPPKTLRHYFSVENAEDIYPRLGQRAARNWHESWLKHRAAYYKAYGPKEGAFDLPTKTQPLSDDVEEEEEEEEADEEHEDGKSRRKRGKKSRDGEPEDKLEVEDEEDPDNPSEDADESDAPARTPGRLAQFLVLLERRWKIFMRDRVQLILHLAMLFGFPILVVIFALDGIAPLPALSELGGDNIVEQFKAEVETSKKYLETGRVISGLIMFQVILLTLMGSNNSAREIAAERPIFEKEKLAGLHVSSYILSKIFFLTVLVAVQALWMGVFVQMVVPTLPGDMTIRLLLLVLVNGAMTAICLGFSGILRSPEQANLCSVYLVGFQLPLSGAVLTLPNAIEPITRPFISAFWGWSGALDPMRTDKFFDAVTTVNDSGDILPWSVCAWVLALHILVGIIAAYIGSKRHQWD